MITSVELGDFVSHRDTRIELGDGVTVFIGQNGSGKSSVIDAITFALFGQHTRKANRGLIRRGAVQGFATVCFTAGGRKFEATRKVDRKGGVAATLTEVTDVEKVQMSAGERKGFNESTAREVERIVGLGFDKLRVAAVVQQGQLDAIINAKPKEFKELLNTIIGIDRLDQAVDAMRDASDGFRGRIRERTGHDDTHIESLRADLKRHTDEVERARPARERLESEAADLRTRVRRAREGIEADAPKVEKVRQLDNRRRELRAYAEKSRADIQGEIDRDERRMRECEGCFERAAQRGGLESEVDAANEAVEESVKSIQKAVRDTAALEEQLKLAGKMTLKDGKCPVCDQSTDKLKPFYDEGHLRDEIGRLQAERDSEESRKEEHGRRRKELADRLQDARDAEATLRAHSVDSPEDLSRIGEELEKKRLKVRPGGGSPEEMAGIDSHAGAIFEDIKRLEEETAGFDPSEFSERQKEVVGMQRELERTEGELGEARGNIARGEEEIRRIEGVSAELEAVKEYMDGLDQIKAGVYGRDGPVATSLRSWALDSISIKASEYLERFNTKIQRIRLTEKARDVSITCHARADELDVESLSGGERAGVALALRLGMASLLGASNLGLMILDEPTGHLDAERKKALVGVLSQLSNVSTEGSPMQFLIVTHDGEIFDDAAVEQVYRFESGPDGSRVTESRPAATAP